MIDAAALWSEAVFALTLFAVDPGIGLRLAARAGPVRQEWLRRLRAMLPEGEPFRKMPTGVAEAALLGGLDLAASLETGQPVLEKGLIASADGGVLCAAMAERMGEQAAGLLALALDRGMVTIERDGISRQAPARIGVLALDEGMEPDEAPPAALCERLGLWLSLEGADPRGSDDLGLDADEIAAARRLLAVVRPDEAAIATICQAAMAFGIVSLRVPSLALRAAAASAALAGRDRLSESDLETAIRLVLLPRAVTMPPMPDEPDEEPESNEAPDTAPDEEDGGQMPEDPPPPEPEASDEHDTADLEPTEDTAVETTDAALPADLLKALAAMARPPMNRAGAGRKGAFAARARRGRAVGTRPGDPRRERLDLIATLRAAAPWQPIRRKERAERTPDLLQRVLEIRSSDIRIRRHRGKSETATIFAVDASGSAALARLAEAKGAVERILAECYVRRDRVALVAFRGTKADVLLTETKSLTRAKRSLAALPAGGGTPLATGILAALDLARASAREGRTPLITLLTDGRANIALSGAAGRPQAIADARDAAKAVRASGIAALVIDLAQRPSEQAREIAAALGATYLALPRADSKAVSDAVAAAPRGPAVAPAGRR
ncbi:magnesium chelatase subunit D [Jiella sp. KSK16Y-1]|uniref:Magnesium chelatase subunit D n=1 Tax=Jiella mangrovi TaxID=2821407 RepID=A0ABS4BB98_9HYPH|nr:magnesium chelatase subunit D [Jiella mangrovi]